MRIALLAVLLVVGCGPRTSPIYEGADSTVLRGAQHEPKASACVCMCNSADTRAPIPPLLQAPCPPDPPKKEP